MCMWVYVLRRCSCHHYRIGKKKIFLFCHRRVCVCIDDFPSLRPSNRTIESFVGS